MGADSMHSGFEISGDGRVLEVSGEIDISNVEAFRAALEAAAGKSDSIRLRFGNLEFIDVAGFKVIADVAQSRPGLRIVVVDPTDAFCRHWEMLGYRQALPTVYLESDVSA